MEHKDIWLVLGWTVILAIAVSLSTVAITGDAISWSKKTINNPVTICNNKPTTCEPTYIQTLWQDKAVYVGNKKVTLVTVITVSGKSAGKSNVEINVDGIKGTVYKATDFHNNLKTINGLTFKVNSITSAMSPSTGVSSADVMIGTCQLTGSCPC